MEIVNIDFKTYIYNSYNILIKTYLSPYKEIIKFIIDKEILINDYLVMSKFENIPKLLSVLKDRTSLCFERINGRTLRIYISEKHDLKSRLDIYTKILGVFEKLHNKNILHCDISLDNILINYKNEIFIIDFSEALFINQNISLKKYISINKEFSSEEKYSIIEKPNLEIDIYSLMILIKYIFKNEVYIFKEILDKNQKENFTNWYKNIYLFIEGIRGSLEYN